MDQPEVLYIARLQYGQSAYAFEERRFTGKKRPQPDGWILPEGEIYGYSVGYIRKGKRGGNLYTRKGFGSSFREALARAELAMTPAQKAAYDRRIERR